MTVRKKRPRLRRPWLRVKQVVSTCFQQNPGFSLVELLTTLSLLLLLLGTFSTVFIKQVRFCQKIARESASEQIKNFAIEKIKQDVRAASELLPSSTNNNLLLLVDGQQVGYSLTSNKVRRKENAYTQYLTDTGEIKTLLFEYPKEKTVRIILEDFSCLASLREL